MEKQIIRDFQLPVEDGIGILVTFMLMVYEEQACPECKALHDVDFAGQLKLLKSYPDSEEERQFLFFMLGCINQHSHLWTMYGTVMRMLTIGNDSTEDKLKITEQFILQTIFDPEDVLRTKLQHHVDPKLN